MTTPHIDTMRQALMGMLQDLRTMGRDNKPLTLIR